MSVLPILEKFGEGLDVVGVLIIVVGAIIATILFVKDWFTHKRSAYEDYKVYR